MRQIRIYVILFTGEARSGAVLVILQVLQKRVAENFWNSVGNSGNGFSEFESGKFRVEELLAERLDEAFLVWMEVAAQNGPDASDALSKGLMRLVTCQNQYFRSRPRRR